MLDSIPAAKHHQGWAVVLEEEETRGRGGKRTEKQGPTWGHPGRAGLGGAARGDSTDHTSSCSAAAHHAAAAHHR